MPEIAVGADSALELPLPPTMARSLPEAESLTEAEPLNESESNAPDEFVQIVLPEAPLPLTDAANLDDSKISGPIVSATINLWALLATFLVGVGIGLLWRRQRRLAVARLIGITPKPADENAHSPPPMPATATTPTKSHEERLRSSPVCSPAKPYAPFAKTPTTPGYSSGLSDDDDDADADAATGLSDNEPDPTPIKAQVPVTAEDREARILLRLEKERSLKPSSEAAICEDFAEC